jgi:hypothetical protein
MSSAFMSSSRVAWSKLWDGARTVVKTTPSVEVCKGVSVSPLGLSPGTLVADGSEFC